MNLHRLFALVRPTNHLDWYRQLSHLAQARQCRRLDIIRELLRLRFSTGIGLEEYRYYGLYDSAKPRSWKESFMTENNPERDLMYRALNPEEYWCLFNNKLVSNRYFGALGIPVTTVLGLFDPHAGSTYDNSLLRTEEQLREFLLSRTARGFALKHVEGMRGTAVYVFTEVDPTNSLPLKHIDGRRFDLPTLLAELQKGDEKRHGRFRRAWIIEERLEPHAEIARLVGPTLSCVRMQTFVETDGRPRIIASVIKIPNKARAVDNIHFGGVGVWVDPETGVLSRGRTTNEKDVNWLTSLPWNGMEFYGLQLPFWEEAKNLALEAAAAFPWARCIGWDVAITQKGPVLIEGNHNFSARLVQFVAPQGLLNGSLRELYEASRNGSRMLDDN